MPEEKTDDVKMTIEFKKSYPDEIKPVKPITRKGMKGRERNLMCLCGSGKKYKNCCGK